MPERPLPRLDEVRLALLGACTASFQLLFARELLAAFSGNEVVLASLFGAWLSLTSAGAWLGRGRPVRGLRWALASYGPLSAASLVAARALPGLFPAGAAPGPATALGAALLLLAPTCLVSGLCFAWLARGPDAGGRAYGFESAGAAVAGALLGALALGAIPPFALEGAVCLAAGLLAALGPRRRAALAPAVPGVVAAMLLWGLPVGRWALERQGEQFAGARERDSPLAQVVVVDGPAGVTVYADRVPLVSGEDRGLAEESAHLPLSLHAGPRVVGVLGVPPAGMLREALRHGLARVDCILEDPVIAALLREHLPEYREPRVQLIAAEPRSYLRGRRGEYDALLLFEPEPTTAALNRLYSIELFAAAAAALRPGGLLSVALPGHDAYASLERRRLHSSVARTLGAAFPEVRVLPGALTYDVASRESLLKGAAVAERVAAALASRGIEAPTLSPAALAQQLAPSRVEDAERWASLPEPINRDLAPTTYRRALDRILADYQDLGGGVLLALAASLALGALLVLGPRARPVELAVFTSGASSLGLQLALVVVYQLTTGAIYRELGLLVASTMAGAALGAAAAARWAPARGVLLADLAQAALLLALAAGLPLLAAQGPSARPLLLGAALLGGLLPGAQFAWACRGRSAGALYAADLAGAALASLAVLTLLVPAAGLPGAFLALGAMKAASAAAVASAPTLAPSAAPPPHLAAAVPLAFALFTLAAASEPGHLPLYALSFARAYQLLAVGLLLLPLVASFEGEALGGWRRALERRLAPWRARMGIGAGWLASFAALLPVGAFPVARCYFSVPFVFCHVCPRPCAFGVLRPYAVPAAVIANLFDQHFCQRVCPLGACQAACERLRRTRARRVGWLWAVRAAALAFVAVAYFLGERGRGPGVEGGAFFRAFFRNAYAPTAAVLVAAAALVVASLVVRRPFCEGLCPIGAVADLADRVARGLSRRRRPPAQDS